MEIFNKADLALHSHTAVANEEFVVVFPLRSPDEKSDSQGQLVLFNHKNPPLIKNRKRY